MPHLIADPRVRLRPLAAALALSIASASAIAAARDVVGSAIAGRSAPDLAGRIDDAAHEPAGSTVVVTSCADSGPGTLRDAYASAVDDEEIDLTQLSCSTITLTSGPLIDPVGAASVTLDGPGKYLLAIDGNGANRVIVHNGSGMLGITGLTIRHGSYAGAYGGACIYSYGSVSVGLSIVSGCSKSSTGTAKAFGGAIYARDAVSLTGTEISDSRAHADSANSAGGGVWAHSVDIFASTISGNTASGDGSHYARGGGVFSLTDTRIAYSTLSDNAADSGAAAFLIGAANYPMLIANSTISGNHAGGAGGGIYAKYRPLEVWNSTIAQNTAGFEFGAGLYLAYATDLESSIVAGNSSEDGLYASDIGGPLGTTISGANNLVIASTLTLPPDTIVADPMLGPLQNNGGFSATHALLPGSPAIDHGNNVAGASYDQRLFGNDAPYGYERTVGPSADIGAFESGAPDRIFMSGFDTEP